jgi:PAS domain-containing protein
MDNDDAQPIGGTETRLQAEESLKKALERSESWFRAFFEDIPAGTMVAGPDGLLLSVNRRLCTMTGLAEEELVGRALAELERGRAPPGDSGWRVPLGPSGPHRPPR